MAPASDSAALKAQAKSLLGRALPKGAREVGRSVSSFRRAPQVYEAHAFISWKSPRGKPGAYSINATGREPQAKDKALEALVAKLAALPVGIEVPPPPIPKPRRSKARKPARKSKAPRNSRRGLLAVMRRLLVHLAPGGAKIGRRSIRVQGDSATARVDWVRSDKTPGTFEATVTKKADPVLDLWIKLDRTKRQK